MVKLNCNQSHRFTKQFEDIPQEDIARCPLLEGGHSPAEILARADVSESIKNVVRELPYSGDRAYTWLYIRPQQCTISGPDHRSGAFFHVDVDAVYRCVAPDWEDFRVMIVSFGNVAETQFISDPLELEVTKLPQVSDYVNFSGIVNNGYPWKLESPKPCQVAQYTIKDFHRAGPIRRNGWRLAIVVFETNAPPVDKWPPRSSNV